MKVYKTNVVLDRHGSVTLPVELLNIAKLEPGDRLDIMVAASKEESDYILNNLPDDLRQIFGELGINPDTVREVMRKEGYFL
jgi:bifunctional DNA-binding transcriptional regulator/antitoxin component of YhaV-PrlF toxin-antitoxin module